MKILLAAVLCGLLMGADEAFSPKLAKDVYLDPKEAGADYKIQGEYAGEVMTRDGGMKKIAAQIVAPAPARVASAGRTAFSEIFSPQDLLCGACCGFRNCTARPDHRMRVTCHAHLICLEFTRSPIRYAVAARPGC